MEDIAPYFREARTRQDQWSKDLLLDVLEALARLIPGSVPDASDVVAAGKYWATLDSQGQTLAFVWKHAPLVVLLQDAASSEVTAELERRKVVVILARDMNEPAYRISKADFMEVFPEHAADVDEATSRKQYPDLRWDEENVPDLEDMSIVDLFTYTI